MSVTSRLGLTIATSAMMGLFVLLAGSSGPAAAVDAAKPSPCLGTHITDAAGDGEYDPSGTLPGAVGGAVGPAPDNLEILSVFLNYRPDKDGKNVLTGNIVLKNLSKTVPEGLGASGGNWYYIHYNHSDAARFVRAAFKDDGVVTYAYGNVSDEGVYTTEGDTTGMLFEGPEGVVQIDIPEAIGGKPGEKLVGLMAAADTIEGEDDFFGFNHHADLAPDETDVTAPNGKDYDVVACPAGSTGGGGGAGGGGGGGGGGGTTPTATPTPAPGGGPTPPPGTTPRPSSGQALPLTAPKSLGSAKKAKRKRSLSFKIKAGKPISNLKLALKPAPGNKPAIGTATIKSVKQGTTKVKLKVSKKIKKGKYVLDATGVVDGQTLSVRRTVSVKK